MASPLLLLLRRRLVRLHGVEAAVAALARLHRVVLLFEQMYVVVVRDVVASRARVVDVIVAVVGRRGRVLNG